jgi:hypothetical protein
MNAEKVKQAQAEAKRFLGMCEAVLQRAKTDEMAFFGCAETGALRRASLDLTRSLARLRKP